MCTEDRSVLQPFAPKQSAGQPEEGKLQMPGAQGGSCEKEGAGLGKRAGKMSCELLTVMKEPAARIHIDGCRGEFRVKA